jgi:hypothetical protein
MPGPSTTFTEMVTTTLRNHKRSVVDNISANNALLTYLKKKGKIKTASGGYEIAIPLEYAENGTYQRFSGYDTLNINASDVLSSAKYDWAQVAIHVTASGRELAMNSSAEAMINLVKARIDNAFHTAANNFSIDLYSTGALSNQIGGLGALVTAAGTGSVGGIDSSAYTFWANKFYEVLGTGTYVATPNVLTQAMNNLWYSLTRGADNPDLIVFSHDFYAVYENSLQQLQRFTSSDSAQSGFTSLKYKNCDVIFDSNSNFGTTSETGYFLNTDYLYLMEHSSMRWTQDEDKVPINQQAVVIPIYWMGQLCTSNRSLQGRLIDAG